MSLYAVLRIEKGATEAEIKRAYRKLAMELHPDRGGDAEHFKRMKKAYRVLSDSAARARYDATGNEDDPTRSPGAVSSAVAQLFEATCDKLDVEHDDIIAACVNHVLDTQKKARAQIKGVEGRIARMTFVLNSLHKKTHGEDPLGTRIEGRVTEMTRDIAAVRETLDFGDRMLKVLAVYEYRCARPSVVVPHEYRRFLGAAGLGG